VQGENSIDKGECWAYIDLEKEIAVLSEGVNPPLKTIKPSPKKAGVFY